jgi:hypothetical protein
MAWSCATAQRRTSTACLRATALACSFWLADVYAMFGRLEDAERLFENLLSFRNDLGPLAEVYDPRAKRQLGNFPQGLSHIALGEHRAQPDLTPRPGRTACRARRRPARMSLFAAVVPGRWRFERPEGVPWPHPAKRNNKERPMPTTHHKELRSDREAEFVARERTGRCSTVTLKAVLSISISSSCFPTFRI